MLALALSSKIDYTAQTLILLGFCMKNFDVKRVVDEMIQTWLKTASLADLRAVFLNEKPDASVMSQVFQKAQDQYQRELLSENRLLQEKFLELQSQVDRLEAENDKNEQRTDSALQQNTTHEKISSVEPSIKIATEEMARLSTRLRECQYSHTLAKDRSQLIDKYMQKSNDLLGKRESWHKFDLKIRALLSEMEANTARLTSANEEQNLRLIELENLKLEQSIITASIERKKQLLARQRVALAHIQPQNSHAHSRDDSSAESPDPHLHTRAPHQLRSVHLTAATVVHDGSHQHSRDDAVIGLPDSHLHTRAPQQQTSAPADEVEAVLVSELALAEARKGDIDRKISFQISCQERTGQQIQQIMQNRHLIDSELRLREDFKEGINKEIRQVELELTSIGFDEHTWGAEHVELLKKMKRLVVDIDAVMSQKRQCGHQLDGLTERLNKFNTCLRDLEDRVSARNNRAKDRAARQDAVVLQRQLSQKIYNDYQQAIAANERSFKKEHDALVQSIQAYATASVFEAAILADGALQPYNLAEAVKRSLPVIRQIKKSQQALAGFHTSVRAELGDFQAELEKQCKAIEAEYQAEFAKFNSGSQEILSTWSTMFNPKEAEISRLALAEKQATGHVKCIERNQLSLTQDKATVNNARQRMNDAARRSREVYQRIELGGGGIMVVGLLVVLSLLVFPPLASLLLTIGCVVSGVGFLLLCVCSLMRGIGASKLKKANAGFEGELKTLTEAYETNEGLLPGAEQEASNCQVKLRQMQEQVRMEKETKKKETEKTVAGTGLAFFETRSAYWTGAWEKTMGSASALKAKMTRDELSFKAVISEQNRELEDIQPAFF